MSMLVPREYDFSTAPVGTHMTVVETGTPTAYILCKVSGDRWVGHSPGNPTGGGISSGVLARTYHGEEQAGFPVQVWLS